MHQRWGVVTVFGILCAAAMILTACPKPPDEFPESASPRPIGPGEEVTISFASDGLWHPSGFFARTDDRLRFALDGEAKHLSADAIELHIGRSATQLVYPGTTQRVDRSGELVFRLNREKVGYFDAKTVDIRVRNFRKE